MHATLQEFEARLRRPRRRKRFAGKTAKAGTVGTAGSTEMPASAGTRRPTALRAWFTSQAISLTRHAAALPVPP